MKRILSLILSAALLCACMFALASCGSGLEGTYEGIFITDDSDVLTVTFGKDNAVELSLSVENGERIYKASGKYSLEAEEGHGHEVIVFDISGEDIGLLSFMQGSEYIYSLEKKVLTLSDHDSGDVMELTKVK